ncbi:MAG: lipopolysaccharide biosynthesis [Bryobacterales bacterium]|nr:lipopolysaccharide biosynthesis [Bryobacterales bacterium]
MAHHLTGRYSSAPVTGVSHTLVPAPAPGIPIDNNRSVNFFQVLRKRKWTLLACVVSGTLAGALVVWRQPYTYQARVLLELQDLNENLLNSRDVNPAARLDNSSETYINTEAQILQSRPVFERVSRELNEGAPPNEPWMPPITAEEIARNVRVRSREADRILELVAESLDPRRAAAIANAITTAFVEQDLESRVQAGRQTTAWLSKQLDDLGDKLRRSENELQAFVNKERLLIDSTDGSVAETGLRQVQGELAHAEAERIAKQSALDAVKTSPPEVEPGLLADPTLQQYQIQLTALRKQLAELEQTYAPDYYKIPPIRAQLAIVEQAYDLQRKAVREQLESDYRTAQRREGLLHSRFDSQFTITADQTAKMVRYNALKSALELNRTIYGAILQKVKSYGVASAMQTSNVRVVEPAVVPDVPSRPNKPLISALGALGFLFAGMVWVLSRAANDTSIQEPGEAQLYMRSPELGVIPSAKLNGRSYGYYRGRVAAGRAPRLALEMAASDQNPSLIGESFRSTTASLLLQGKPPGVLLITSLNPADGKTTIASNLAIALTSASRRVLLVDADRRRARLHSIFRCSNARGLNDLLEPSCSSDVADFIVDTPISNLFILPSGKAQPATGDLLYSPRMASIIHQCRRSFDLVVIDTPPVLYLPDARILGRLSDGVILVLRAGRVRSDSIIAAERTLRRDGVPIMGTILNDWDPKTNGYGVYPEKYY